MLSQFSNTTNLIIIRLAQTTPADWSTDWRTIVTFVLLGIVVLQLGLAFVIYPFLRKKRNDKLVKEQGQLLQAIVPGKQVLLTSNIFGTVKAKTDSYLLVEIAPNTTIKVTKDAILGFFDPEIAKKIQALKAQPQTQKN